MPSLLAALILTGMSVLPLAAQQGSNLDPPPPTAYEPPPEPIQPDPEPPPGPPFWKQIDYADPANLGKIALLLGAIIIARRSFREMKGW